MNEKELKEINNDRVRWEFDCFSDRYYEARNYLISLKEAVEKNLPEFKEDTEKFLDAFRKAEDALREFRISLYEKYPTARRTKKLIDDGRVVEGEAGVCPNCGGCYDFELWFGDCDEDGTLWADWECENCGCTGHDSYLIRHYFDMQSVHQEGNPVDEEEDD